MQKITTATLMRLHCLDGYVLQQIYFSSALHLGWGKLSVCPSYECGFKKNKEKIFFYSLHSLSVFVLPVLCYCVILPTTGYLGNVDIYSLSLQRYKIRYCKDLTFFILWNTDLQQPYCFPLLISLWWSLVAVVAYITYLNLLAFALRFACLLTAELGLCNFSCLRTERNSTRRCEISELLEFAQRQNLI